ncbi:MAG: FAD-dependent oxidoreductase [Steroidobacteraceae bacterium]
MKLEAVFSPIRVGGVDVPNRIVRTAHITLFANGAINDDLIAYHVARAKGGVGLSIIEAAGIHPSGMSFLRTAEEEGALDGYRRLMQAVRPHGMKVLQQLWHGGHQYPALDGGPPWGASAIPNPTNGIVPIAMTAAQLDELVTSYVTAAMICERGGLDGVEVHAGHGYLIAQFLARVTNARRDLYGGDLGGRMRLLQEILRGIRAAVQPGFVLGIRVSASSLPDNLTEADLCEVVQQLERDGLIDYLNVSLGDYYANHEQVGGMDMPSGYQLDSSGQIAAAATMPTIVTGRFRTLEEAEEVIRSGAADMVSMVRAHIADPDIVRKTREGRVDEIRPCIGCNQGCVGGANGPAHRMGCTVNPAVGFERALDEGMITKTATPKKVLIIGGGPGGLEAARVAALRGHRVVLAEALSELGGSVRIAARAPRAMGIADITQWLEREVYRLGVEIRTSTYVEAQDVMAERPDVVIVATGSTPRMDGVQHACPVRPTRGVHQAHVLSSWELLTDPRIPLGRSAVVLDDLGHYEAIAAADFLLDKGVGVTFVTPFSSFAPQLEAGLRVGAILGRLRRGNFNILHRAHLNAIDEESCEVSYLDGGPAMQFPADTVVLVSANAPRRDVYDELSERVPSLHLVGDAKAPRDLQAAIREGHLVARTI